VNRTNFWWRLRSLFGATLRDHAISADSHSAHMEASMIGALKAALTCAPRTRAQMTPRVVNQSSSHPEVCDVPVTSRAKIAIARAVSTDS